MTQPAFNDITARYDRLNQSIIKGAIKAEQAAVLGEQYAYPVSKDALGIAHAGAAQLGGIDATEHSVPFIISTQEEDRDGDIVVSSGGDLGPYSRNPIVLFGHGSWQIPIGTAKNRNGELCVWCEESRVRAKCFFDMPDPDAAFIYGKVERGILNATSISFLPVVARKREFEKAHREDSKPLGWIFDRWELTEFSIVAIPANAGAIRDSLDSEKSFISPKLQKALLPFAAVAKGRCFSGYCPCPPCEEKGFNEGDHPRGQPDNAGQFGPASGLPADSSGGDSSESSAQSYVDAFAGSEKVTIGEVTQANQELADEDSEYRVIPDGGGGWQIFSATDLGSDYGEDWMIRQDVNGKWEVVNGDDFPEPEGTPDVRGYSDVFDEDPAGVTEDELDQANQELENEDSDWRVWPNPANGRWEPVYLENLVHEYGENYRIRIGDSGWEVIPGGSKEFRRGRYKSHVAKFLYRQKVKDMKTLDKALLTSGLPGAKKACHKSTCKCKKCKKELPEQDGTTSGATAAGVHEERNEHQEEGAEQQKGDLETGVAAKMPKLMECGYTEPQAMCLAAHLHGKGLEGEDITGHEEAAKALGYKKDDMGGDDMGAESMSLKSFVKAMKAEAEVPAADEEAGEVTEKPAEEEKDETEEEPEQYKPSAKMLGHMHNHMKNAHDYLSKELPLLDHEKIAKAMTAHCKDLEGHMENYKDLAATHHPDADFDKMCKSLEGGETETNENEETPAPEATSGDDHEPSSESGEELIREYQHPKGGKRTSQKSNMLEEETMKSLAGTLERVKGFVDQRAEAYFEATGRRI